MRYEDLENKKFGKLTCIEYAGNDGKRSRWKCRCVCGNIKIILKDSLKSGASRSCGCGHVNVLENVRNKYGVDSPMQVPYIKNKIKETCIKKYGYDIPMRNLKVSLKVAKTANQITELLHWFSKEGVLCRGSYEVAVVEYFNKNKIDYNWQAQTFTMPDGRTYTPDCYLPDEDKWIEIKGYFYGDAEEKWNWFHNEYSNSELWNYDYLRGISIL